MAITHRGKAVVEGTAGAFDLIVYPITQKGDLEANWEEEIVKDVHGGDAAWLARNLHYLANFSFKVVGDSAANAKAGAAIIAPLATVTLSAFDIAAFNGVYQNMSGQKIDLSNVTVADMSTKFRRYDDAAQAALAATVPG
jgi:hypothetical protein